MQGDCNGIGETQPWTLVWPSEEESNLDVLQWPNAILSRNTLGYHLNGQCYIGQWCNVECWYCKIQVNWRRLEWFVDISNYLKRLGLGTLWIQLPYPANNHHTANCHWPLSNPYPTINLAYTCRLQYVQWQTWIPNWKPAVWCSRRTLPWESHTMANCVWRLCIEGW